MSRKWTIDDLQALANKGIKVEGLVSTEVKKQPQRKKVESKKLIEMKQLLNTLKIDFKSEYRFHEYRKFRFDIALVDKKIAFEYEGIISAKSRHTSMTGYSRDADKYNLAQEMGWRVFRYTALNYKNFIGDLKNLLQL
jgi:hypothetical protein